MSYSDLQLKLQKLRDLDLSVTTYEEILRIINEDIILPIVVTKIFAGNYIERIRINKEDEIFFSPLELSYRLNPLSIDTYGRANSRGTSVFYGAVISSAINLPRLVALAETEELLRERNKRKQDKTLTITLGKWKIVEDMLLAEIVFQKDKLNQLPELKKALDFHTNLLRKDFSEENVRKIILLLEFYSDEFAKSEINTDSDYKISAAYAESILKLETIQGIIYPSVRTDYSGSNVALTPKTVDNNLQLEEAFIIRVNIKGKRVFLNNIYRTGILQKDAKFFDWQEIESTPDEIMDSFFSDPD